MQETHSTHQTQAFLINDDDDEIEEALIPNNPNNIIEEKIENFILLNVKFYIYRQCKEDI